jgi:hypothetical protein
MATTYTGKIGKFEVQDGSRQATIEADSTGWVPSHPNPFKLSNDSDTEFLAMCDVCAAAEVAGRQVTVTVISGNPDEIDKISA